MAQILSIYLLIEELWGMVAKIAAILALGCVCKTKARGRKVRNYLARRSTFMCSPLG